MMPRRLLAAAVAFGALCRVQQYAANTSLWHDESFVALNVLHLPFTQLFGALDWYEPSPPGFLVAEKLTVAAFGTSEYALRALPLLAGLAGLVAFAHLARRVCTNDAAALWAVVLLAASTKLIVDASQVKHFTLDLFVAVMLAGLAWRAYRADAPSPWLLVTWGGLAAIGLWFSYATAFGFAASSLVLAVPALRRWPAPSRRAYAIANLLALASFAALLAPIHAQRSVYVLQFWSPAFPDVSSAPSLAIWFGRSLLGLFNYFWQPFGAVLALLAGLAAQAYWRTDRRPLLALLWLPVGFAALAAALHWWPFGGNAHMVFAAPAVVLLAGEGLEIARAELASRDRRYAWAALALLLAPGLLPALYHLAAPHRRYELREAIAFMQQHGEPGDQLAVFDPATFLYYTGRDQRGASFQFADSARVWVLTTRSSAGTVPPAVQEVVDRLSRERPRLAASEVYGGGAYLYGAAKRQ